MDAITLVNIKGLVQVREVGQGPVSGADMAVLPVLPDAFLILEAGRIADFGPMSSLPGARGQVIDCSGRFVFPGWVDSHTHLVFARSREEEFVMKIEGASYQQIAAAGGGILNSARALAGMSENELFDVSVKRAWEILRTGTVAVEIKSGYGLSVREEVKMLRVARRIGRETPLVVKTTFLGAHAVPADVSKSQYIKMLLSEMIPAIANEKLADYIDVFCEAGFFSPEESIQILEEGKKFGWRARVHANQLGHSGGVKVGVQAGAASVDHLEHLNDDEIEMLRSTDVMPTALPGAAFFLNLPYPPARKMMKAGLPLAIATDYNPGSAPSGNMLINQSLACIGMRMTPAEVFNACTLNTAASLNMLATHGSITRGKAGSVVISKPMPSVAFGPYNFGSNWIEHVIAGGKVIQ
ncbi:MAG: imidazolonepropionase [Cyclobacteriaceae bacterium]|jgi:imidazolonepropionase